MLSNDNASNLDNVLWWPSSTQLSIITKPKCKSKVRSPWVWVIIIYLTISINRNEYRQGVKPGRFHLKIRNQVSIESCNKWYRTIDKTNFGRSTRLLLMSLMDDRKFRCPKAISCHRWLVLPSIPKPEAPMSMALKSFQEIRLFPFLKMVLWILFKWKNKIIQK